MCPPHHERPGRDDVKGKRACIVCWKLRGTKYKEKRHFKKGIRLRVNDIIYMNYMAENEQLRCNNSNCRCVIRFDTSDSDYAICAQCVNYVRKDSRQRKEFNKHLALQEITSIPNTMAYCCGCQCLVSSLQYQAPTDTTILQCYHRFFTISSDNSQWLCITCNTLVQLLLSLHQNDSSYVCQSVANSVIRMIGTASIQEIVCHVYSKNILSSMELVYSFLSAILKVTGSEWYVDITDNYGQRYNPIEAHSTESTLIIHQVRYDSTYKSIKVYHDGSFSVFIGNKNITSNIQLINEIPQSDQLFARIITIWSIVDNVDICIGCEYAKYESLLSGDGYVVDKSSLEWTGRVDRSVVISRKGKTESLCVRARSCIIISNQFCITGNRRWCSYCEALRVRLTNQLARGYVPLSEESLPHTQKSQLQLVDEIDRIEREYEKNIAQINAQREYWIDKCHTLEAETSDNLFELLTLAEKNNCLPREGVTRNLIINHLQYGLKHNKRTIRWHPTVIRFCIELQYHIDKTGYEFLASYIHLPSDRTLHDYRPKEGELPGINKKAIKEKIAFLHNTCKQPLLGGIVFDGIKIKDGLVLRQMNGRVDVIGFVDSGDNFEHEFEQMKIQRRANNLKKDLEKQKKQIGHKLVALNEKLVKLRTQVESCTNKIENTWNQLHRNESQIDSNEQYCEHHKRAMRQLLNDVSYTSNARRRQSSTVYVSITEVEEYLNYSDLMPDKEHIYGVTHSVASTLDLYKQKITEKQTQITKQQHRRIMLSEKITKYQQQLVTLEASIPEHVRQLDDLQRASDIINDQLQKLMDQHTDNDIDNNEDTIASDTEALPEPEIRRLWELSLEDYMHNHNEWVKSVHNEQQQVKHHRKQMATEILQFHFQSIVSDISFSLCHIETHKLKCEELMLFFWRLVTVINDCYIELKATIPDLKQPCIVFA